MPPPQHESVLGVMARHPHKADIVIFGGGIAGLWLLALLRSYDYNAFLLESDAFGAGQSIASQGILHRGYKYLTDANFNRQIVRATFETFSYWRDAFWSSRARVPLPTELIASERVYYLSHDEKIIDLLKIAERELNITRPTQIQRDHWPSIFASCDSSSELFAAEEIVIDVPKLLGTLSARNSNWIYKLDGSQDVTFAGNEIRIGEEIALDARCVVFCAGKNNEQFLSKLDVKIEMQDRPLSMVIAGPVENELYAHFSSRGLSPDFTITTHLDREGTRFWYIGGELAEKPESNLSTRSVDLAKAKLRQYLPDDYNRIKGWKLHYVHRAEPAQIGGGLPSSYFIHRHGHFLFAWPSKLCLAPAMCRELLTDINALIPSLTAPIEGKLGLEQGVQIASPPWE
jgi:hypothetical protein